MERPIEQNKGIVLKEYGRNIQNIVNYILEIQDRDKRSKYAKTLIELMKQINPAMRDAQDYYHKLWDHLYIMSNFKLDVDTPYPAPEISAIGKKPMKVAYNTHNLYFKHYGRNIELLIGKAIEMEDKDDKYAAILYIGKLMKRFYASWNKENIDDEVIVGHLKMMSKGKLLIPVEEVKAGSLFDSQKEFKEYKKDYNNAPNQNNANSANVSGGGSSSSNNTNRKNNNRKPQDKRRNNNQQNNY
jgi:hypothetical protein